MSFCKKRAVFIVIIKTALALDMSVVFRRGIVFCHPGAEGADKLGGVYLGRALVGVSEVQLVLGEGQCIAVVCSYGINTIKQVYIRSTRENIRCAVRYHPEIYYMI